MIKLLSLFVAGLAVVNVASAAWTEISLEGAQAWASSEANADQTAMKVIDGSGFTSGIACPSGTVDTVAANMWLAKSDDQSNHWWMVKFPTTVSVGALRLWNYNQANNAYRGFKGVEIYISTDENIAIPTDKVGESLVMPTANWQLVHPYAFFPQAAANNTYEGAYPTCIGGNHQARYLLIKQIYQHASGTSAASGISEIKFYTHTWTATEPDSGKLYLDDGYWRLRMLVVDAGAKTLQVGTGTNWQQWGAGTGYISGNGDVDFTDVFAQTGWKVTKLRSCCLNNGSYGAQNWDRVTGCFAPDVIWSGGQAFASQSRFTYVKLSSNLINFSFSDYTEAGKNYGNGFIVHPGVYTSALTEIGGGGSKPGKFKNKLDFSKCTSLTILPEKAMQYGGGCAEVVWPKSITTVSKLAFLGCAGNTVTFTGPPPTTLGERAFDHEDKSYFITIYCNNKKYPAWNDWVTTPLTDAEKEKYPDGIGWSMTGVGSAYHANLLRCLPTFGLRIILR